jgi:hypothetical protein
MLSSDALFFSRLTNCLDFQGVSQCAIEGRNYTLYFKHWMPDGFQSKFSERTGKHFRFDQTGAVAEGHEFHKFSVGLVVRTLRDYQSAEGDALANALR